MCGGATMRMYVATVQLKGNLIYAGIIITHAFLSCCMHPRLHVQAYMHAK